MGMMGMGMGMMGMGGMGGDDDEEELDKVAIGLNFVRNETVRRQPLLQIKAAMRKMTLDEDEIEEVLAQAGLQPEEPQYGVRTKRVLDERTAARYRRHEAAQRVRDAEERAEAAELFDRVSTRPPTFFYELERAYNQPYGAPSEETPSEWLPRLIALEKVKPETRIWTHGMADWEEWQDCQGLFGLPDSGPGSAKEALYEMEDERSARPRCLQSKKPSGVSTRFAHRDEIEAEWAEEAKLDEEYEDWVAEVGEEVCTQRSF